MALTLLTKKNEPSLAEQRNTDLETACKTMEGLIGSENGANQEAEYEKIIAMWDHLDPDLTHPLYPGFKTTRSVVELEIRNWKNRKSVTDALTELCERVKLLGNTLPQDAEEQISEANRRWDVILSHADLSLFKEEITTLETRFDLLCEQFIKNRKTQLREAKKKGGNPEKPCRNLRPDRRILPGICFKHATRNGPS